VWVVEVQGVDKLVSSITQLYSHLNVKRYQLQRERQLEDELTELQRQIEPFEQVNSLSLCTMLQYTIEQCTLECTVSSDVYSTLYVMCVICCTLYSMQYSADVCCCCYCASH